MRRSASVWRWQLMLAASTVLIVALIAAFRPEIFGTLPFLFGIFLITVITLATLMVPWHRVRPGLMLVVPFADILAVGLAASASDVRLSFLWVFPVTWIASYYAMPIIIAALALISVCLAALSNSSISPSDMLLRIIVTVLSLGFLATTIRIGTQQARAARRLLLSQSEQMNRIAQRAEAHEHRVTQIIDSLDLALAAVTADGRIVKSNDAYRQLYRRSESDGDLPSRAVEYDDRQGEPLPPECTAVARAARGDHMQAERMWLFDTTGEWRALQVSSQPIATVEDRAGIALLIIEDVTALLAAAQERKTVAAIVSHELRNPLTAIIGHVDLLRDRDDLPERVQEQLSIVASAADRMERLVARVMEESHPDAAVLSEPVDLRQLVDASIASFLPIAQSHHLTLTVEGAQTLMLYGDAFRLRQVIDNLISNAVKYTPSGGHVVVWLGVAPDGQVDLQIVDTGMGMTDEDLARVFQPYFRAEAAAATDIPGTGLGMGVVEEIIHQHGGTIGVGSVLGAGTTVSVRLPRKPPTEESR